LIQIKKVNRRVAPDQTARNLDLSVGTVKVHVKHVLKKLELKTRAEAAVWVVNSQR
jgi:two-component system nitrate/nitrite response regulator NarL